MTQHLVVGHRHPERFGVGVVRVGPIVPVVQVLLGTRPVRRIRPGIVLVKQQGVAHFDGTHATHVVPGNLGQVCVVCTPPPKTVLPVQVLTHRVPKGVGRFVFGVVVTGPRIVVGQDGACQHPGGVPSHFNVCFRFFCGTL